MIKKASQRVNGSSLCVGSSSPALSPRAQLGPTAFSNPCVCNGGTGLACPDARDPSDAAGRRPAVRGCIKQCTMPGDTAPFHGKLVSESRFDPTVCGIIKPIKFY